MGGAIVVPAGSCENCNGKFGRLEAALKNSTKPLLNLLQIKNRHGIVPKARVEVSIQGIDTKGLFGFRDGDGEINLADVVINHGVQPDGRIRHEGFFPSKNSAEQFVKGAARRKNAEITELGVPREIVFESRYNMPFSCAVSKEALKVVAKIALASVAYQFIGTPFVLSEQFDRFRQAMAEDQVAVSIFANERFMTAHARSPYQHSVMCYLSAGFRKGWALVTLFGGLTYIVEFPSFVERESRMFSIFFDAATKRRVNPVVIADEYTLVGDVLSPATRLNDEVAMDLQWFKIIEAYCKERGIESSRLSDQQDTSQ